VNVKLVVNNVTSRLLKVTISHVSC